MSPRKRNRRKQLKAKAVGQRERRLNRELKERHDYMMSMTTEDISNIISMNSGSYGPCEYANDCGLTP